MKYELNDKEKEIILKVLNGRYQELFNKELKTRQEYDECKTILKLILKLKFNCNLK